MIKLALLIEHMAEQMKLFVSVGRQENILVVEAGVPSPCSQIPKYLVVLLLVPLVPSSNIF